MEINCNEVTGWECDFKAVDETADGIRQQMIDHFLAAHPVQMEELSDKQQSKLSENIEELLLGQ